MTTKAICLRWNRQKNKYELWLFQVRLVGRSKTLRWQKKEFITHHPNFYIVREQGQNIAAHRGIPFFENTWEIKHNSELAFNDPTQMMAVFMQIQKEQNDEN